MWRDLYGMRGDARAAGAWQLAAQRVAVDNEQFTQRCGVQPREPDKLLQYLECGEPWDDLGK